MELNVGDYVRTKYGISQYKEYETPNGDKILCIPVKDGSKGIFANIEDIINSKPEIIDLIEVGDYVNGLPVVHKTNDKLICGLLISYKSNDIKTIVTKEQMKQMEYKVED